MDANGLYVSISIDRDGNQRTAALCTSCICTFLFSMAHEKRDEFERLVEAARAWKPGDP